MAEIEETPTEGPGKLLQKARSDHGFSQEEVAHRLHLSVSIVNKLENNQFDDDMPDAFARGYLRNYAKLVDIEPQEIVASYSQFIGSSMVRNYYEPSTELGEAGDAGHPVYQWLLWVIMLVVLVILIVWFVGNDTDNADQAAVVENTGAVESQSDTNASSSETPVVVREQADSIQLDAQADNPVSGLSTLSDLEQRTSPVPTGFVPTKEAILEFTFADDCWVQVTDANGEVLAVGLKTAGRQFQVAGMAPVDVVLGKPRAVTLAYNDEVVELGCFPAATTARFQLDRPVACDN